MSTSSGDGAPPSHAIPDLSETEQRATVSKITWRLMPVLFLCYIIAYVDRINVGFAKLQLQDVLGVSPTVFDSVYGLGAGLFFIGYFIFEVPSNLILHRVGARVWIARIIIIWGFVSMGFMFMKGVTMFYVMRFLLGVAEAGFFPGIILYLTYWYTARERARMVALFTLAGVASGVIGSPISGAILRMNGVGGLAGWQWLFLLEAIPAVLMGFVVLWVLPNRPQRAPWLSEREKTWMQRRLEEDEVHTGSKERHTLGHAFGNPYVWLFCLLYFLMNIGGYGCEMWFPSIIKGLFGKNEATIGWINAIPYFFAGVVMIFVSRYSDRSGERRLCVVGAAFTAAIGFALAAFSKEPLFTLMALTLAFAGIKSTLGPFWAMCTAFFSGTAAAGGIALINSVGNLGGFVGPYLVGAIKDRTDNNTILMLVLGSPLLLMGIFGLIVPRSVSKLRERERNIS